MARIFNAVFGKICRKDRCIACEDRFCMEAYRSGHNGTDSKSCDLCIKLNIIHSEAYRSGHNGLDSKSCDLCIKLNIIHSEAYRSGHNGLDSKSSSPQGLVGSNPTASARKALKTSRLQGFFLFDLWCPFLPQFAKWCPWCPNLWCPVQITL